jgi:predicted nucleic acid-binding Zn ribbon protein
LTNSLDRILRKFSREGKTRFYLSEFVEESNCPTNEVEDYLIPLLGAGNIEGKLELRCPNCGKDIGLFNRFSEIPESIACESCGQKFAKAMEFVEIVLEIKKPFFRDQESTVCNTNRERS